MEKSQTERIGVHALGNFFSEHGWLFREQSVQDYGIDAHVEIVREEKPTGKLIALQIKTGISYFAEEKERYFIFRPTDTHVSYWLGHSMPVVVVLYHPKKKTGFFAVISRDSLIRTGKGWRMKVPKENDIFHVEHTLGILESLTQPNPYVRRLNRLRADRRWLNLIDDGQEVRIKFDCWVNKSLPRYQISIWSESLREEWPTLYMPGMGVREMLVHFFPWAKFEVDPDEHRENAEDAWSGQCLDYYDSETGTSYYSESFENWYRPPKRIEPVAENGETETYVLILTLNSFGKGFLKIDDYLSNLGTQEYVGFTMN